MQRRGSASGTTPPAAPPGAPYVKINTINEKHKIKAHFILNSCIKIYSDLSLAPPGYSLHHFYLTQTMEAHLHHERKKSQTGSRNYEF